MTFKAMVLDERDVLMGVVELAGEDELTERHVDLRPLGGACDRPAGEYRWDRQQKTLVPLARAQRRVGGAPTLEQAVAFKLLADYAADPKSVPEVACLWLDEVLGSVDFKGMRMDPPPLMAAYIEARGLATKGG